MSSITATRHNFTVIRSQREDRRSDETVPRGISEVDLFLGRRLASLICRRADVESDESLQPLAQIHAQRGRCRTWSSIACSRAGFQ